MSVERRRHLRSDSGQREGISDTLARAAAALILLVLACASSQVRHYAIDCARPDEATPPRLVSSVDPIYPRHALRNRITGFVEVRASVGPAGEVVGARVSKSEPPGVFDAAALRAFRQWRYCPPSETLQYPDGIETRLRFELAPPGTLGPSSDGTRRRVGSRSNQT